MLTIFEKAFIGHLVADWLLQNNWMAENKGRLLHPAAWVHSGIHTIVLGIVLGWQGGLVLGFAHLLIDTRKPLQWWAKFFGKTSDGSKMSEQVAIWCDQVLHIASIGIWIALMF